MTGTNVLQAKSGIKVNVGCGSAPTPGWINFDNSLGVRAARFPGLRRLGLLPAGPRHQLWMYDGESLNRLLREAGFAEVTAVPPGQTRIAGPGRLDRWERASESVYVEAVKPS